MKKSIIAKILLITLLINSNLNCDLGDSIELGVAGTAGVIGLALSASMIAGMTREKLATKSVNSRMQKIINETVKKFPYAKDWKQIELAIRTKNIDALKKVLNPSDPEFSKKINSPLFLPLEPIKLDFKGLKGWDLALSGFKGIKVDAITFTYIATPLLYAAFENFTEGVKYLIENGANVNDLIKPIDLNVSYSGSKVGFKDDDINGFTPLHLAVVIGNEEMIKVLVENGANVNAREPYRNRTPLDSLKYGSLEQKNRIREYLIEHGANPR